MSADAPSFQTHIVSGELQVVGGYNCKHLFDQMKLIRSHLLLPCLFDLEFPEESPSIGDIKQYYSISELLETNCTSNSSIPPAKLEWWINDMPIYTEQTLTFHTIVDTDTNRETSILGLRLALTNEHFYRGRVKVSFVFFVFFVCLFVCESKSKRFIFGDHANDLNFYIYFQLQCIAKIYDIYEKDVVKYIDEYYPQILANSENGGVHSSFMSDRDAAGEIFHILYK